MKRGPGYTLMELVVVIAIAAMLAIVAGPRLIDTSAMRTRTAARNLAADIRFAQRLATTLHQECGVKVTGANTYTVFQGTVDTPATDPLTREPMLVSLATPVPAVSVAPIDGSVTFDVRGRPKPGFTATFDVGGRTITVIEETGAVRY